MNEIFNALVFIFNCSLIAYLYYDHKFILNSQTVILNILNNINLLLIFSLVASKKSLK